MAYSVVITDSKIGLIGKMHQVVDERGWLVKSFTEWSKQDAYDLADRLNAEDTNQFINVGGMTYDQVRRMNRE